ncbi:MAG: YtxH domain-containing protein [Chryseosolibacter sp.]
MKTGRAILGVLAGLAAGAVIGVIFATDKESGTRDELSRLRADLAEALNRSIDKKFQELAVRMGNKNSALFFSRKSEMNE